jgi:hypothetical protein
MLQGIITASWFPLNECWLAITRSVLLNANDFWISEEAPHAVRDVRLFSQFYCINASGVMDIFLSRVPTVTHVLDPRTYITILSLLLHRLTRHSVCAGPQAKKHSLLLQSLGSRCLVQCITFNTRLLRVSSNKPVVPLHTASFKSATN